MTRALLVLLTSIASFGQIANMAVTDDGSKLFFPAMLMLPNTTDENPYWKIFDYDGSGFHLFAQVASVTNASGLTTNYYNLQSPSVSGDGSAVSYVVGPMTVLVAGSQSTTLPGSCLLNRNAQFALCVLASNLYQGATSAAIVNVATGQIVLSVAPNCWFPQSITSDGRAVFFPTQSNTAVYWNGTSQQTLPGATGCPFISDDGSHIIYRMGTDVVSYATSTGVVTTILPESAADVPTIEIAVTSISNDGRAAAGLKGPVSLTQAILVQTDGSGYTQLTNQPSGILSVILSGDGSIVYATTNDGQILRIDAATGSTTVVSGGAICSIGSVEGGAVPGSLNTIAGTGFDGTTTQASAFPLPLTVDGVQVTLNGVPSPILSISPTTIAFQIPWETPLGSTSLRVTCPPSSVLVPPPVSMRIAALQGTMALNYPIHQDFSALVTGDNPAYSGEVINFYLTGLGPVMTPVADGALSPPDVATATMTASVTGEPSLTFPVVYAGLAPGLVGIYQVGIQLTGQLPVNIELELNYPGGSVFLPLIPWANRP